MRLFVIDWSVNKSTFDEFTNYLVDCGFDVKIDGYSLFATNGKKNLSMFKGFKCTKDMLAMSKRFKRDREK